MDYSGILNSIYSRLNDIYDVISSLNYSNFYEIIIMILFFLLIINIERGY